MRGHLTTFLAEARARSAHGFGVPWFVEQELTRYLACGILAHGFIVGGGGALILGRPWRSNVTLGAESVTDLRS